MEIRPLLFVYDRATGKRWERPITEDIMPIGREATEGLALPDRQVSRRHATITRQGHAYVLRDTGSRNGTFLNREPVSGPRNLHDGDEIAIASRYYITFVGSEATAPMYRAGPMQHGIYLDRPSCRVWVDGVEIDPPISLQQYQFLLCLVEKDGDLCTRNEMVEQVWPDQSEEGVTDQAIDALARRLRSRLEQAGVEHPYIETVRGHGFRLNKP